MDFDELRENIRQSQIIIRESIKNIEKALRKVREIIADSRIRSFEWDPSKKEEFIEQLCDPEYIPTVVDELICKKLSGIPTDDIQE